jgi:hypothetical protein
MATLPSVTHWKSRLDPLRALDAQAASVELAALGPPRPKDHEVLSLLGQLRAAPARLVLLP